MRKLDIEANEKWKTMKTLIMKRFLLFIALDLCIFNSFAHEKQDNNDSIFIFFLKDTLSNTSLSKLVDFKKSKDCVIALHEKNGEYYGDVFKKDVEIKDSVIRITKWNLPNQAVTINKDNCYYKINNDELQYQYRSVFYPQKGKYTIKFIKNKLSPTKNGITLFYIHDIPCGLWALKDGILLKVIFRKNKVCLVDGDNYFTKEILPLSPNGIDRVLNGESFFPYVVK